MKECINITAVLITYKPLLTYSILIHFTLLHVFMLVVIALLTLKPSSLVINLPVFENEVQITFTLSRLFEV
jgi:hypothetical protein